MSAAAAPDRAVFDEDHHQFRATARRFVAREIVPHFARWERDGIVDRDLFAKAGAIGLLGFAAPEAHGGGGVDDFRFNAIVMEEVVAAGVYPAGLGLALQNDIVLPYFLHFTDEDQRRRWLPGVVSGELVAALAMTEPGAGSDVAGIATTAVRHGDHYVVNGSKTFITSGINADVVVVAVRTGPDRHGGLTLLVLERGMPGFERGRNLDKLGQHSQDTAELFFSDVQVPVANRLGAEGEGFRQLMANLAQERLSIAVAGVAAARYALDLTVAHCREREAFGQPIGRFQHTRFALAELATEVEVAQAFVDQCLVEHGAGALTAERAAMAKWWCSELQFRACDVGVQLHGGYGYMEEYPIARAWADARITRIYGGTTEIMKEIVGRGLGL